MPITPHIQRYFWDVDPKKARPKSHPQYYIKRILEYGDEKAFSWLKRIFGSKKILKIAKTERISPKSKNYWVNYLSNKNV